LFVGSRVEKVADDGEKLRELKENSLNNRVMEEKVLDNKG
jgi:hypothetical protein